MLFLLKFLFGALKASFLPLPCAMSKYKAYRTSCATRGFNFDLPSTVSITFITFVPPSVHFKWKIIDSDTVHSEEQWIKPSYVFFMWCNYELCSASETDWLNGTHTQRLRQRRGDRDRHTERNCFIDSRYLNKDKTDSGWNTSVNSWNITPRQKRQREIFIYTETDIYLYSDRHRERSIFK